MIRVNVIDELESTLRALADTCRSWSAKMPVVYVCHPLGGDVDSHHANALIWMRLLFRKFPWVAFQAPWLVDAWVLDDDDPAQREAALLRGQEAITRCDGAIFVGGRISPGMKDELRVAEADGLWLIDATPLGYKAPLEALAARGSS